jgi:hypothetical protein
MSEADLHATVAEFLDWALMPPALYTTFPAGWCALPKATAGRLKACGLKKGMPDILVFYDGRTLGIELKAEGGRPSLAQQCMFHQLREAGVLVYICESVEDVAFTLRDSGVPMRRMGLWHDDVRLGVRKWQQDAISEKRDAEGEGDGAT